MVNKSAKNATLCQVIDVSLSYCYQPFVAVRDALARQKVTTQDLQMQAVQGFVQADF